MGRGGEALATGDACTKCRDGWAIGFSYLTWEELIEKLEVGELSKDIFHKACSFVQSNNFKKPEEWGEQEVHSTNMHGNLCFRVMKAWTRAEFVSRFGATPEQLNIKPVDLVSETGANFKGILTVDQDRPDRYCYQFGGELASLMKILMGRQGQVHTDQASATWKHELSAMEGRSTKTFLMPDEIDKRAQQREHRLSQARGSGVAEGDEDNSEEDDGHRTMHSFAPALAASHAKAAGQRAGRAKGGAASAIGASGAALSKGLGGRRSAAGDSGDFGVSPAKVLYSCEHAESVISKVSLTAVMDGALDGRSVRPIREWGDKYALMEGLKKETDMLLLHADKVDNALALADTPRSNCAPGYAPFPSPVRVASSESVGNSLINTGVSFSLSQGARRERKSEVDRHLPSCPN